VAGCAQLVSHESPLNTSINYTKANIAGQDTGRANTTRINPAIARIQEIGAQALAKTIQENNYSPIAGNPSSVNFSGKMIAGASPDSNLTSGSLKRVDGKSPTIGLYTPLPENIATAQMRCTEILSTIRQIKPGNNATITTTGLSCEGVAKTLNIDSWSAPLTKVGIELEKL
jgi:hypothetical protein